MAKSRELLASDRYMGFILSQNEKKKKKERNQWNMGKYTFCTRMDLVRELDVHSITNSSHMNLAISHKILVPC